MTGFRVPEQTPVLGGPWHRKHVGRNFEINEMCLMRDLDLGEHPPGGYYRLSVPYDVDQRGRNLVYYGPHAYWHWLPDLRWPNHDTVHPPLPGEWSRV